MVNIFYSFILVLLAFQNLLCPAKLAKIIPYIGDLTLKQYLAHLVKKPYFLISEV